MDILQLISDIAKIIERGLRIMEIAFNISNGIDNNSEKSKETVSDK